MSGCSGGAGPSGAPASPTAGWPRAARLPAAGERGSQALEFALVLPSVLLFLLLLVGVAWVGADLLVAHNAARQGARVAAVADDDRVVTAVQAAAGRPADVVVDPPDGRRGPGDAVTVVVRLPSAALARLGLEIRVPGRAVMLVEGG